MNPTVTLDGREHDCTLETTDFDDLSHGRRVWLCRCSEVKVETDLHGDEVLAVHRRDEE